MAASTTPVKVCWLSGNYHERQGVMSAIKSKLADHEISRFEGQFTFAYFEERVYNTSCFAEKRLFIVKDMPQPNSTRPTMLTHLKKLLDALPDDLIVIFDGIEDEDAIAKHVAKIGKVYEFEIKLNPNSAVAWVKKRFEERGKSISDDDAQTLIDSNGYDPKAKGIGIDAMQLAIKKLCLYIGNRKKIVTKEDILTTAFPSEEFIIWSITDAMDSKDIVKCYEAWDKLVANTTTGGLKSAAFTLFSIIQARYRLLTFLREGLAKNLTKAQLAKEAASFEKLKQSGDDFMMVMTKDIAVTTGNPQQLWSDFVIQAALNGNFGRKPGVELYNRKDLFRILQVIQDSQVELRLRKTESGVALLVDALFFAVCGKMDDIQLATIRCSNPT